MNINRNHNTDQTKKLQLIDEIEHATVTMKEREWMSHIVQNSQ